MNTDTLTPASRKVIDQLGYQWLPENELLFRSQTSRGEFANGIRELVRDDLIEVAFRGGKKVWRRCDV